MTQKLYYDTVSPLLLSVLKKLMSAKEFNEFRLVGGTSLSFQRGHRMSADIDLFTEAEYGTIDFKAIDRFLKVSFTYFDAINCEIIGMGKSYYVGRNKNNCIKLDVFYTDKFIRDIIFLDKIRFADTEEIIAMKLDIISRGGRKKDFWDIHELMDDYSFDQMLALHKKRYPFTHDRKLLKKNFTDFTTADDDFDPVCLKNKHWELIKLDLIDFVKG